MERRKDTPGNIVTFRERDWIVLPSQDEEVMLLKPLGGSDDEITGVYLPLHIPEDAIEPANFPDPEIEDLADFESAKMLFNAARLSFRNASGPFRCFGKLSFRPRSYQVVPLVKALEQDTVRLLIADDVGIGKTVEALMILREMMERGEVKRFAIICLPHLCEQWQQELKDKLDIDAEIIRSSTAASLDRKLSDDRSVFYHLPFQVISIDYIKSDKRRGIFLNDCPELVIVDEAHSCARPAGASSPAQQQRYHLLHDIARNEAQHLILLTATPHSGKDEEFQSLLGLLVKEFESYSLSNLDANKRKKIARHFIQRKRENIKRWIRKSGDEKTPFPERLTLEAKYDLSEKYNRFYHHILEFARGISKDGENIRSTTIRYWAALALLRGVMSSPAAAFEMLQNRRAKKEESEDAVPEIAAGNSLFEKSGIESDTTQVELLDQANLNQQEIDELNELSLMAIDLFGFEHDLKAKEVFQTVQKWVKAGLHPIIFCKYVSTANYLGKLLKENLKGKVDVQVVTSELADEQRRERIDAMEQSSQRVLIATDCLSEGINLQDLFNAVIHYDLPWNPNRIEQREGRVDRYGQMTPQVKSMLVWSESNPIDRIVLKILIRKVKDIQRTTGVSITLGEENTSIMEAVIKDVILGTNTKADNGQQIAMFADEFMSAELENARKKAENLRSIFAHESVDPEYINQNLEEIDEAIGDLSSLEEFICQAVVHLKGNVQKEPDGYLMNLKNLPEHLQSYFPTNKPLRISFESPTPPGYRYLGRNHQFAERLCQFILSLAFEEQRGHEKVARAAVIQTSMVERKTTLIQFRVRNVIKEIHASNEVISEEMFLWGYSGSGHDAIALSYEDAKHLLLHAPSTKRLSKEQSAEVFLNEKKVFGKKTDEFEQVAKARAEHLVEAHDRFKKLVKGKRFEAVHPVLPPDLMGVYILNPVPKDLF
jgi:superfamily II DNA or RNA helicase